MCRTIGFGTSPTSTKQPSRWNVLKRTRKPNLAPLLVKVLMARASSSAVGV